MGRYKSATKPAIINETKKAMDIPPKVQKAVDDVEEDESNYEDSDPEDDGVDEAGMNRLMELLGDDALDEFDFAQLNTLTGGTDSGEEGENSEGGSESGSEQTVDEDEAASLSDESSEYDDDDAEDEEDQAESADEDAAMEDEEAIPLEDASSVDEDAVPRQKVVIDNKVALQRIRETIKLDSSLPWTETLTVTYPEPLEVPDAENDLERELAFYKQALHGAQKARMLAQKASLPFTRPNDYFAEMVKSDAHMERVRQRLLDERAGIVKSEDARRQRELKKVGKQVQVEKLKERAKGKKDMEDRLKGLKRKRGKGALDADNDDDFDVAVEDAISDKPSSAKRQKGSGGASKPRMPRSARDTKFGFGGGGYRRGKQNTKESTNDFDGFNGQRSEKGKGGGKGGFKKGGGSKRPGKSKRHPGRA